MSWLRRVAEQRNLENPDVPLTGAVLLDALRGGAGTSAGVDVSPTNAPRMTAVYRAWSLIAGTTAGLPLHAFRNVDDANQRVDITPEYPILRSPHPDMTDFEFWELAITHLMGWGNFFAEKRRDARGRVVELWPFVPSRVRVGRPTSTRDKTFFVQDENGRDIPLSGKDVFHIPGLGYDGLVGLSPIAMAREAIAAGLAAESYANRLWASGALAGGVLTTDARLKPEDAEALKRRWQDKVSGLSNAHDIAVLDMGTRFDRLSIPPQDAQFLESRRFQVTEIARLYGLPPHLLGETDRSTSWGTGIATQTLAFVVYTLMPGFLKRVERRITKEILDGDDIAEYSIQGLLRGDNKARADFYKIMVDIGAMTIDEVRDLENLPPLGDGEEMT